MKPGDLLSPNSYYREQYKQHGGEPWEEHTILILDRYWTESDLDPGRYEYIRVLHSNGIINEMHLSTTQRLYEVISEAR